MSVRHFTRFAVCLAFVLAVGCTRESPKNRQALLKTERELAAEAEKDKDDDNTPKFGSEVLDRMVIAYRKALRYADAGTVRLVVESNGKKVIDESANYSLTFERPNKIRLQAYRAMLVSDGTKMYAALEDLPGQVLVNKSPLRLTMKNLYADRILAASLTRGIAGTLPQLVLLLADDPMKGLIGDGEEKPKLIEPGKIDDHECYRVLMNRADGPVTFWVDKDTYVLRRVGLPIDDIRRELSREMPVDSVSLEADFPGAKLDGKIDPKAFEFAVPEDAQIVKFFIPPNTAQLLGKKLPAMKFVDMAGKPVTSESLAGKITVLDFWATTCGPCRISLPNLEKVYQQYKDNPKVAFYAVSIDRPDTDNKEIAKMFADLKVSVPILRDMEGTSAALKSSAIPLMFIVGADGVVQDFEVGMNPKLADALPEKLKKLLAGENIYEKPLREYEAKLKEYEKELEKAAEEDHTAGKSGKAGAAQPVVEDRKIPDVKIEPRSEPAKLKLAPLWKCADVKYPANVIVIGEKKGQPRLAVVDGWKSVAEVGLDGKLIKTHKLDLANDEVISSLRTAVGADGKQYVVAFLTSQQRCHVLDENWKVVANYPEDALKNMHGGIADVQIGDVDGDGKLELCVSYWGLVGVQGASLDGKRLWTNRLLSNVLGMAIGPADDKGRRGLICANTTDVLKVLNGKGEIQREMTVRNRSLQWIAAADLAGDGKLQLCAISARQLGENVAVGLSPTGEEQWNYPLPLGVPHKPVEMIVAGRVTKSGPGQWILPGPDGSIHFISADGKPLDKFNYGAALQGLATVEIDGKPALVVSSEKGLEALRVE